MNLNSIRWRLPLSYASIALLAALSLGSLMLLVLNGYYSGQERDYLMGNAEALRPAVAEIIQSDLPAQVLQDQVKGLGFLSRTQIRVLDRSGRTLADSGIPVASQVLTVSGATGPGPGGLPTAPGIVTFSMPAAAPEKGNGQAIFYVRNDLGPQVIPLEGNATFAQRVDTIVPVSASPYGYGFATAEASFDQRRSAQVVQVALTGNDGALLGSLEISHGPAYGADVLNSVALAWLAASVVAILLAALAGWLASRQVTRPVLALTDATQRMERGDLSARVALPDEKQQEFQALAHSFNSMAGRMEDTVSALREFVSNAAHELNTPLTALKTNLELAANESDPAKKSIFLDRALAQNQRLELLTGGLLDLSRIEAAQAAPERAELDLRQLTAEAGERFASRAEQAERGFVLSLPEGAVPLRGNTVQLQRALDNLLENALKFTPAGGTIRLGLEQHGREAILSVSDSGIGIPAEDLPHLFERFQRGHNVAGYPGNGLGLAIVAAIARAHGGQVQGTSAGAGQGSTFTLILPAG